MCSLPIGTLGQYGDLSPTRRSARTTIPLLGAPASRICGLAAAAADVRAANDDAEWGGNRGDLFWTPAMLLTTNNFC